MPDKFKITYINKNNPSDIKSGNTIENKSFEPDDNGNTDLYSAWQTECKNLDKQYPNLKHQVKPI